MDSRQQHIINDLQVAPWIDPEEQIRLRVNLLVDYVRTTGLKGYVLGISGGQDSTLAGWLAQRAVEQLRRDEPDREVQFVALRLPYGQQGDEEDAQLALKFIDPDKTMTINIKSATDALVEEFARAGVSVSDFNKGNIKARQRMVAHYAIAGDWGLGVLGSDHAAEAVAGFFTKFGDGAADVMPLTGLTKRQGRQLLITLGCPLPLYDKIPTADLLDGEPGQSDEAALGVSYQQIDEYLEGGQISPAAAQRVEALFHSSMHKRRMPVTMFDDWWRKLATED